MNERERQKASATILENRIVSSSRDFTQIENAEDGVNIIIHIAELAGKSAASEAKALKIPKLYANATQIIKENASGEKEIVATSEHIAFKKFYKKYDVGTVLYATGK